jgi:hypothetical protein
MPPQSRTRRLSPAEQTAMRRRDDDELRRRDAQTEAVLAQISGQRPIPSHTSERPSRDGEHYDYNAAIDAGYGPDASGHWPSEFKLPGHPDMVVGGFHTQTGARVPGTRRKYGDDLVAAGWSEAAVKKLDAAPEPIVSHPTTLSTDAYQGALADIVSDEGSRPTAWEGLRGYFSPEVKARLEAERQADDAARASLPWLGDDTRPQRARPPGLMDMVVAPQTPAERDARQHYAEHPLESSGWTRATPRLATPLDVGTAIVNAPLVLPAGLLKGSTPSEIGRDLTAPLRGEESPTYSSWMDEEGYEPGVLGFVADLLGDVSNLTPKGLAAVPLAIGRFATRTGGRTLTRRVSRQLQQRLVDQLRPTLGAPELARFEQALSANPDMMEHLQFLRPGELPSLLRSKDGLSSFLTNINALPPASVQRAAALLGEAKLGWYEQSRRAIEHMFGADADRFAGVLAATSPQTSVESNLTNALNFFVDWRAANRPRDEATIRALLAKSVQGVEGEKQALDAWIKNTVRVMTDKDTLSGPKVNSFWANLRARQIVTPHGSIEPQEAVTLDAWMGSVLGVRGDKWFSGKLPSAGPLREARLAGGDPGLSPGYLAATARIRQVAVDLGISPAEAQETIWSAAYATFNKAKSKGISPSEVLSRGLLTRDDIVGTPDFSTLLNDPSYRAILSRDEGLAARLPGLADIPARTGATLKGLPTDPAAVKALGRILDDVRRSRRTEKAMATAQPTAPPTAVITREAVGDPAWTSVLPSTVDEPQRVSGSQAIFRSGETPSGHEGTLKALLSEDASIARMRPGDGTWRSQEGSQAAQALHVLHTENRLQAFARDSPDEFARLTRTAEMERNPLTISGVLMEGTPKQRQRLEQGIRAESDIYGALTGQSAMAHTILDPSAPQARWNAVTVAGSSNSKPINSGQFKALAAALPDDWVAVHKHRGIEFLHVDPATGKPLPVTPAEVDQVGKWMSDYIPQVNARGAPLAWSTRGAENVAERGYRPIAEGAAPGSGQRTERAFGTGGEVPSDWSKFSARAQRRADPWIKKRAKAIVEVLNKQNRLAELRRDELELLTIAAEGGGTGVSAALGDPTKVLPALAALGIGLGTLSSEASRDVGETPL